DALVRVPWAGLIFDEAHYIKNHRSQRSRHARRLVDAASERRPGGPAVYALTGTPRTNRPRDLFPLLQLAGHPMGRSFLSFAKRYCAAHHNGYGWVTDGASNLEELAVQLQGVMLRRAKTDVLELPPKLRTWLAVDVPARYRCGRDARGRRHPAPCGGLRRQGSAWPGGARPPRGAPHHCAPQARGGQGPSHD